MVVQAFTTGAYYPLINNFLMIVCIKMLVANNLCTFPYFTDKMFMVKKNTSKFLKIEAHKFSGYSYIIVIKLIKKTILNSQLFTWCAIFSDVFSVPQASYLNYSWHCTSLLKPNLVSASLNRCLMITSQDGRVHWCETNLWMDS